MGTYVWAHLKNRKGRASALAAGILVAAVSFVLLTAAVSTSSLQVKQAIDRNYRGAYDILVRPKGSYTPLERKQGLVRNNYLGGIFGGISFQQYREIKRIPGIDVAAPIANIGYILPFTSEPLYITKQLTEAPAQLYRLKLSWSANHGLARYPGGDQYIYYSQGKAAEARSPRSVCINFNKSIPVVSGAFSLKARVTLNCFAREPARFRAFPGGRFSPRRIGTLTGVFFPFVISAIDPAQESKLVGLRKALVSGSYLRARQGVEQADNGPFVGVIASTKTFVDERLLVGIQRLETPPRQLAARLANPHGGFTFASSLGGRMVGERIIHIKDAYRGFIRRYSEFPGNLRYNSSYLALWTTSEVRYRALGKTELRALAAHNPPSTYLSFNYGPGAYPQDNRDTQFRRVTQHEALSSETPIPGLWITGRFDPSRLTGFSRVSRVPLETYYPPFAQPADPDSERALHGHPLGPTMNLGGYIAQPPLMLTTLRALKAFQNPNRFRGVGTKPPISVIRVRVAGVKGADALSRERIRRAAQEINRRTGLAVDVTAGSSQAPVTVHLPRGRFGAPPLTVREGWTATGVAVSYLRAVDRKSLFLLALVLTACGLFVMNAALASVRARRTEVGTLLCIGWSRRNVFSAVVLELALIGALAGAVGVTVAVGVGSLLSLQLPGTRTLLVLPLSVFLAVAAGWMPARRAAKAIPLDAVAPVTLERGKRRPVGGYRAMAVANLSRVPGRTLLGASGLIIGVAALTVLIALNSGFQQTLAGTFLGNAISVEIRGVESRLFW